MAPSPRSARQRLDDQLGFSLSDASTIGRKRARHELRAAKIPRVQSWARCDLATEANHGQRHVGCSLGAWAILFWQANTTLESFITLGDETARHLGAFFRRILDPALAALGSLFDWPLQARREFAACRRDRHQFAITLQCRPTSPLARSSPRKSPAGFRRPLRHRGDRSAQPLISRFRVFRLRRLPALAAWVCFGKAQGKPEITGRFAA